MQPIQHSLITAKPLNQRIFSYSLAIVAGMLLTAAFAPLNYPLFALICPAFLLWSINDATPAAAFRRGFCFGLGFFGSGVSWIYVSMSSYGEAPFIIVLLLTACFMTVISLYPAVVCYLTNQLFPNDNVYRAIIGFPVLWTLLEWLRGWLFTGFPWLLLGYSQSDTALAGFIPIIGVFGVSFTLCLLGGCLYRFMRSDSYSCLFWVLAVIATWLLAAKLWQQPWTQTVGKPVPVAIVQGNVSQPLKWNTDYLIQSLQRYQDLTAPLLNKNIVVWPEAAIATGLENVTPYINMLRKEAKASQATILTGVPIRASNGRDYYNGVLALGMADGQYYKRNVVPFGEYLPLRSLFAWLEKYLAIPMSDIIAGPKQQQTIKSHGIELSPLICYEVAYANSVRSSLPRANLLVTVTNDDWFGHSFAPAQHTQIARIRSLQTGRYQLMAANTGISTIIDEFGRIKQQAPQFTATVLIGNAIAMSGSTPWVWLGNTPILALLMLLLVAGWLHSKMSSKQNADSYI